MIRLTCILLALILLTGCDNEQAQSRGFGGDVVEFYLSDGTRCAVFTAYQKGGLSCDWN